VSLTSFHMIDDVLSYCSFKSKQSGMKNYGLFYGNTIGEGISQNGDTIIIF
jgi:hypothetical protein